MDPLRKDPTIAPLIAKHGELTLTPAEDPFERLVVSIVNQQLSTASAAAIRDRLFDQYDITPEEMYAAHPEELRSLGLSRQKIEYIKNAAAAFNNGLSRDRLQRMTDDEVITELTAIKGIGIWTAKMFLMFVLAREDVFPVEDLGIRNGMQELYGELDRPGMVEKAEDWRPYRSIASLYVWRVVD